MFFSGNPLDRQSEKRRSVLPSNAENICIFHGKKPLISKNKICWVKTFPQEYLVCSVYLGYSQELKETWAIELNQEWIPIEKSEASYQEMRPHVYNLELGEAAIIAQASSLLDWNKRYIYCSACGSKTSSGDAGYKRICPSQECIGNKGVQSFSYPRTDAVVIMCIISKTEKCLLARQSKWPKNMYSCVAGFVECGETMEEACRREAKEETGIVIGEVSYEMSQPWPFPSQLMLGCFAMADTDDIELVDKELEEARWFDVEQVRKMINRDGAEFVPPSYAIAHQLLYKWAFPQKL